MNWTNSLKTSWLVLSNTLNLVILLSIFSIFFMGLYSHYISPPNNYSNLPKVVKDNYVHMPPSEVNDLLNGTWSKEYGWVYEQWLGFREKERKTKYVNVNEYGFRVEPSLAYEIGDLNNAIWFFGGSTTFGYGVADNETIPAFLGSLTNEKVVNLGRAYYYSAQENLLLTHLISAGYTPQRVIFLDGINERCSIDTYQTQMEMLFEINQRETSFFNWLIKLFEPTLTLLSKVLEKIGLNINPAVQQGSDLHSNICKTYGNEKTLEDILASNLEMRKTICLKYDLDCTTFVQPFAGTHGQHTDEKFDQASRDRFLKKFIELEPVFRSHGAVFVTDSLDGLDSHSFIDDIHYSKTASQAIAEAINKHAKSSSKAIAE